MHSRKIKISSVHCSDGRRIKNSKLQNSSKKLEKKRKPSSKRITCKVLKTIVSVMSLVFFFYQSMIFLNDYYTYPTTTRFAVKHPKEFRMPCITFCNTNPIKRSKFCSVYPHLCEAPSNLTEFCLKYPHMCLRNKSNLVIPKFDRHSSKAMLEMNIALSSLYKNRNMSQYAWSTWSWDIPKRRTKIEREMTASLVREINIEGYPTCYSANLRFTSSLPASSWAIGEERTDRILENFVLHVEKEESFYPWNVPLILFAVHSPFIPVNPIEGKVLKIGHIYLIGIKLEEEHLLSYPYQTDCIDYDALWRKYNKTGPRSQEACKQGCYWNNSTECNEFHKKAKMILYTENMCSLNFQNKLVQQECIKQCKTDCEKLKYGYKIIEFPLDESSEVNFKGNKSRMIVVNFFIDDPQVVEMSHIPLYDVGDMFSYIGGLMGCWLGVSVATLTGILETSFTEAKHMASKLRRCVRCCFKPQDSYINSHKRNNFISIY